MSTLGRKLHATKLGLAQKLLHGGSEVDIGRQLVYAGWIFSFPGSDDQPWHQDGMPLFPTIITPVRDQCLYSVGRCRWQHRMTHSGPTDFVAESHRLDADSTMDAVEKAASRMDDGPASATTNEDESPIVSSVLKRGDIRIYDYRICHRGTSNLTNALCYS
jgi:ectoine hydroxylase-related dioxygenase (phytanoyl-CoA dioxygenase family)